VVVVVRRVEQKTAISPQRLLSSGVAGSTQPLNWPALHGADKYRRIAHARLNESTVIVLPFLQLIILAHECHSWVRNTASGASCVRLVSDVAISTIQCCVNRFVSGKRFGNRLIDFNIANRSPLAHLIQALLEEA
jgi:hypothetical protein